MEITILKSRNSHIVNGARITNIGDCNVTNFFPIYQYSYDTGSIYQLPSYITCRTISLADFDTTFNFSIGTNLFYMNRDDFVLSYGFFGQRIRCNEDWSYIKPLVICGDTHRDNANPQFRKCYVSNEFQIITEKYYKRFMKILATWKGVDIIFTNESLLSLYKINNSNKIDSLENYQDELYKFLHDNAEQIIKHIL